MSLDKIMSVSGKPGLFRLISQAKSGFVVESITDGKRTLVDAHQRVSMLKDITVYTTGEDMPLRDILKAIRDKHEADLPVNAKSEPDELKRFFKSVVPDFDEERVYVSDIRKIVSWSGLLKDMPLDEPVGEDTEQVSDPAAAGAENPGDAAKSS